MLSLAPVSSSGDKQPNKLDGLEFAKGWGVLVSDVSDAINGKELLVAVGFSEP